MHCMRRWKRREGGRTSIETPSGRENVGACVCVCACVCVWWWWWWCGVGWGDIRFVDILGVPTVVARVHGSVSQAEVVP
jgi:hypothetical protein